MHTTTRVQLPGREIVELLGSAVPSDHASQTLADDYIGREIGRAAGRPWRVLDLGCGSGSSRDVAVHCGLDVPDSREADARTRTDASFETFDGVSIPFDRTQFDLVYCKQVLEQVRHPGHLLAEVHRVLAPGGYLAGSTSQLEPFHSMSMWNYTPVGFSTLMQEAGLRLVEVRPGIDALTLIARRLVRLGWQFDRLWAHWWGTQSPLNRMIGGTAASCGWMRSVNARKLVFSGQFSFLAQRVDQRLAGARSTKCCLCGGCVGRGR